MAAILSAGQGVGATRKLDRTHVGIVRVQTYSTTLISSSPPQKRATMSKCKHCHGTGTITDYEVGSGGPIHEYACSCKKSVGSEIVANLNSFKDHVEMVARLRAHIRTLRKRGEETAAIDLERILDGEE